MKKTNITYALLFGIWCGAFVSCQKSTDLGNGGPSEVVFDFEVVDVASSVEKDQQGNDVIKASIAYKGEYVDQILFYSGDLGNEFDHKEGRVLLLEHVQASFATTCYRTQASGQGQNQLSLVVSKDMNPDANLEGTSAIEVVKAARWTDLTSRFKVAPVSPSDEEPFLPSGVGNITTAVEKGKPFYVAFKYETQSQDIFGRHSRIQVRDYVLTAKYKDYEEELILATGHGENWSLVTEGPIQDNRTNIYTEYINFRGNHNQYMDRYHAFWAVGLPVTVNDIRIDPIAPQTIIDREGTVSYTYYAPGEYEAVFEISKDGKKQVYRKTIQVGPAEGGSGRGDRGNVSTTSFNGRSSLSRFAKE